MNTARFLSLIGSPSGDKGCREWLGGLDSHGYGQLRFEARPSMRKAHRVAWEQSHGEIPAGLNVLHACDNPKCCEADAPGHLFLGTLAENVRDMDAKGRRGGAYGELQPNSKLKWTQVDEIRQRYRVAKRGAIAALAVEFCVSEMSISLIVKGKTWKPEHRKVVAK